MTESAIDQRINKAARHTNIAPSQIDKVRLDLRRLKELGVVVKVSVKGTSLLSRRTTRAELGMTQGDARIRYTTTGATWRIDPADAKSIRSIETRLHQVLDRYSFDIDGVGAFVPFTAFSDWKAEYDRLSGMFDEVKLRIMNGRNKHIEKLQEHFAGVASQSWASIMGQRHQGQQWSFDDRANPPVEIDGRRFETFDGFAAYVINRAMDGVPTSEELQEKLSVSFTVAVVAMGSEFEREFAAVERARVEAAEARHAAQLEAVRSDSLRRQAEEQHRQEIARIQAETRLFEEQTRRELAETVSPFAAMFDQLRQMMLADASAVIESLGKNGRLVGPSVTRAENMIETFRLMNASNDTELEALMRDLEGRINNRHLDQQSTDTGVGAVMQAIAAACKAQSASVTRHTRQAIPAATNAAPQPVKGRIATRSRL